MGLTKTKKAIMALQERVNTIEMNVDLIQKAVSEEDWKATKQCAEEIKTLLEAYEKQKEFVRNARTKSHRKIVNQRNKIRELEQSIKKTDTKKGIRFYLADLNLEPIQLDRELNQISSKVYIVAKVVSYKTYERSEIKDFIFSGSDIFIDCEKGTRL